MRITRNDIVEKGIWGDIAINVYEITQENGDIFNYGSIAFDSAKLSILIKGAEVFNPVVDVKALGYDTFLLIKDYQDPKSTNWKIAADTIAVLGDGIAVATDFTPAGLARKLAIGTSLDLMRKAVKGVDTSSGLAADFCAAMDLFLPQKDKGGNGDDPGTPGSSPGTPGSGAGTPDGSPGTPGSGTGTPDGSPGMPNGGTGTPGSSPGTPRGGHGWPLGSGWFDWLPDSWWTIDPLVIEFSKGAKSGTNSHTHFDFDGDGFAEYTEWISDTQGLLVRDRNQNGVIDDGKELFGDYSVLNSGKNSRDGFEALADFDTNGDGCVDASDDGWSKLRVWMDNGDGFSQENLGQYAVQST